MRKYNIHYLTDISNTAALSAREHVAAFMEGVSINNGQLIGENANIGPQDSVSVIYVPQDYLGERVQTNLFLIEVFDYYVQKLSHSRHTDHLMIHSHTARVMLARAYARGDTIQLHPVIVERAVKLAHEFMCVLNVTPNYMLKHLDIGATFVVLTHGPK